MRCCLLGILLASCAGPEADEARELRAHLEAIEESTDRREERLAELAALPLTSKRLRSLRDQCRTLHEATFEAERESARAGALLAQIEATPGASLGALGERASEALERSKTALVRAEEAREPCVTGQAMLRLGRLP